MVTASTTRFEESDKSEATDLLKSMGLTFNGYLNMAVKQLINQRRIPFEILPAKEEPSEETRRAMIAAEAKEYGLIYDDSPSFTTADEAINWLDGE